MRFEGFLCVYVTYVNPVRMFSSDDLPAPDGPMMAVSSPDLKHPDTPFRMFLFSAHTNEKETIDFECFVEFIVAQCYGLSSIR